MKKRTGTSTLKPRQNQPEIKKILTQLNLYATSQLQEMFDGIDDSFFELANAAHSNQEQDTYFEAMREVRLRRSNIETDFLTTLETGFDDPEPVSSSSQGDKETTPKAVNHDSLSLIQDDALEEKVALDSMVTKIRANYPTGLHFLEARFSSLYHAPEGSVVNPLDSRGICNAFKAACDPVELAIKERLILYKQFDRYFVANLGALYDQINVILKEEGILPNLKFETKKSRYAGRKSPATRSNTTGPGTGEGEAANSGATKASSPMLPEIHSLLAAARQMSEPLGGRAAPPPGTARLVSEPELVDMLTTIQRELPTVQLDQSHQEDRLNIRDALQNLLEAEKQRSGENTALNQINEDLINLVSMLFEFILDDHNLSAPIKVLISRLQIPILKIVIKDPEFFAKTSHPARRLLNMLAKAGIGWNDASEKARDRLFQQIESVVHRILEQFDGDISLFQTLLDEFSQHLEKEEKKVQLVERRTRETESGKIKSEKAKVAVKRVLDERIGAQPLPKAAITLLREGWSHVLFLACIKDDSGHRWKNSVTIIDVLIWCLQPHTDDEDRERWARIVPKLLKNLRIGLTDAAVDNRQMEMQIDEIKKILTSVFNHPEEPRTDWIQEKPTLRPREASPKKTSDVSGSKGKTAVEKQAEKEAAAIAQYLERVDHLSVGDWVEFVQADNKGIRCRLTSRVEGTDWLIFVNRMGVKVAQKTREEIAKDFRRGRVKLIEGGLLLDRAMESIMSRLRTHQGQAVKA